MAATILLLLGVVCCANKKNNAREKLDEHPDITALEEWRAGETVDAGAVIEFGLDRCFVAETISDGIWQRMQGKSYKYNPYVRREDLRHIKVLHWDYDQRIHIGEMVCNKDIADVLVEIFRLLYDGQYNIQRMVLPDVYNANDEEQMRDNNSSCFCYRVVAGSKNLSKHALGLAVDINPLYNPYCKVNANGSRFIQPSNAGKYCDRSKDFRYKIDRNDLAYRLFTQRGFKWGGDWKSRKDYQHFEYQ